MSDEAPTKPVVAVALSSQTMRNEVEQLSRNMGEDLISISVRSHLVGLMDAADRTGVVLHCVRFDAWEEMEVTKPVHRLDPATLEYMLKMLSDAVSNMLNDLGMNIIGTSDSRETTPPEGTKTN